MPAAGRVPVQPPLPVRARAGVLHLGSTLQPVPGTAWSPAAMRAHAQPVQAELPEGRAQQQLLEPWESMLGLPAGSASWSTGT
jgi:hypothetical protein